MAGFQRMAIAWRLERLEVESPKGRTTRFTIQQNVLVGTLMAGLNTAYY
jgi:hypothetical protein